MEPLGTPLAFADRNLHTVGTPDPLSCGWVASVCGASGRGGAGRGEQTWQETRGRKPIFTKKNVATMNRARKSLVRKADGNREVALA